MNSIIVKNVMILAVLPVSTPPAAASMQTGIINERLNKRFTDNVGFFCRYNPGRISNGG
ncbi:MAG: hypothetical protein GY765_00415 [bacterium]|nr:hypothetical protein [bacterium]